MPKPKLFCVGDLHGEFQALEALALTAAPDDIIIQVGDFGIWPYTQARWQLSRDVYFVDGNHDHIPSLPLHALAPVEVWPHAWYVPRGVVLNLLGRRVLFCGGSKSLDRAWRPKNSTQHGWFEEEQLTMNDVARAREHVGAEVIDLMITHAPPDSVIRHNFSEEGLRFFGHNPKQWVDESARLVEELWLTIGKPPLVCGHMHRSVADNGCTILDINEVYVPW